MRPSDASQSLFFLFAFHFLIGRCCGCIEVSRGGANSGAAACTRRCCLFFSGLVIAADSARRADSGIPFAGERVAAAPSPIESDRRPFVRRVCALSRPLEWHWEANEQLMLRSHRSNRSTMHSLTGAIVGSSESPLSAPSLCCHIASRLFPTTPPLSSRSSTWTQHARAFLPLSARISRAPPPRSPAAAARDVAPRFFVVRRVAAGLAVAARSARAQRHVEGTDSSHVPPRTARSHEHGGPATARSQWTQARHSEATPNSPSLSAFAITHAKLFRVPLSPALHRCSCPACRISRWCWPTCAATSET